MSISLTKHSIVRAFLPPSLPFLSPSLTDVLSFCLTDIRSPRSCIASNSFLTSPYNSAASSSSYSSPSSDSSNGPRPPLLTRLPHHSLSSLSQYPSRPRKTNTPIPPSLQRSPLIESKESPFHYLAVEGRGWDEKKDGGRRRGHGGEEAETGRRKDWAEEVLGRKGGWGGGESSSQ